MDIHPVDLPLHILNIAVLFFLLRLILWKPVYKFLKAREEQVDAMLADAEKTSTDAQELKAKYEKELEDIGEQGRELIRGCELKAEEQGAKIIAEAHTQADEIIEAARDRVLKEKARAVADAHQDIAQLATDMAARILRREVSGEDSRTAAESFFDEMN